MGKMRLPFIDSDFYIEVPFKEGLTVSILLSMLYSPVMSIKFHC
jgi:hypothetical protein